MSSLLTFLRLSAQENGWWWVLQRAFYEFKVKSRWQNLRFRRRAWDPHELKRWLRPEIPSEISLYYEYRRKHVPIFFFKANDREQYTFILKQVLGEQGPEKLIIQANAIGQGQFEYFFSQMDNLGFPPDWHLNPFTGQRTAPQAHWNDVPMFTPHSGDIKFIWEPGRFAHAYLLARAYWVTGDAAYAETFWQIIESWHEANLPNSGAHWKCGQEIALRIFAWCFALYAFADSPATTPERVTLLVGMIAAQADRIYRNHIYAYLQRNNHAISEGVGLWTVGILFPELQAAAKWRLAGQNILEREGRRQIYDDGSYTHNSMNYHRLMLHDYLWAIRLGTLHGYEFSDVLLERVRKAGEFLIQLQDERTGFVPNYGANDGALILPLNSCDYQDFRSIASSIYYLFHQQLLYENGPWNEDLLWLFGKESLKKEAQRPEGKTLKAPDGGYYTLRGADSWALMRCTTYRHRPGHADMLHVDIWRKGINVACDPGSYLYYAEPPWNDTLISTSVHNTVVVDGLNQMEKGPRFLWFNWLKSQVRHFRTSDNGSLAYFEGEHYGYHRLPHPVTHRRAVLKAERDIWVLVDDLIGEGEHHCGLHWLIADLPYHVDTEKQQISLDTGAGYYNLSLKNFPEQALYEFEVVRGTEKSAPRGWTSPYYGRRCPALAVTLSVTTEMPCRMFSLFAPENPEGFLLLSQEKIEFRDKDFVLTVDLHTPSSESIIAQVALRTDGSQEQLLVE